MGTTYKTSEPDYPNRFMQRLDDLCNAEEALELIKMNSLGNYLAYRRFITATSANEEELFNGYLYYGDLSNEEQILFDMLCYLEFNTDVEEERQVLKLVELNRTKGQMLGFIMPLSDDIRLDQNNGRVNEDDKSSAWYIALKHYQLWAALERKEMYEEEAASLLEELNQSYAE